MIDSIGILSESFESAYEHFLLRNERTLFYASNKYRKFLKALLEEEDCYFLAFNDSGEIVGSLPALMKRNERYGNVLNSLPFYGSNGGVIEFNKNTEVRIALLNEYYHFAKKNNCLVSTIISSPLEFMEEFYEQQTDYTFKDSRIGQITALPKDTKDIDQVLMALFHQKTRNIVRKAQKSEVIVSAEPSDEHLSFLIKTHQENIAVIGGLAKPEKFFRLIRLYFDYGSDYKIYIAQKEGRFIAALLLFYFNKTVEYFTPVVKAEYREYQPLSLLIFEAMKDSIRRGYKWWNWGGTWQTQEGVYHFKKHWGTKDKPYYYYTKIFNDSVLNMSKGQLLEEYPHFYVVPFCKLAH
jgi:hypothetical protein